MKLLFNKDNGSLILNRNIFKNNYAKIAGGSAFFSSKIPGDLQEINEFMLNYAEQYGDSFATESRKLKITSGIYKNKY